MTIREEILSRLDEIEAKITALIPPEKKFFPVKEAAERLGIPYYRLQQMCKAGDVPCNKTGIGKRRKTYEVDLEGAREKIAQCIEFQKLTKK